MFDYGTIMSTSTYQNFTISGLQPDSVYDIVIKQPGETDDRKIIYSTFETEPSEVNFSLSPR